MPRFRLPMTEAHASQFLSTAYQVEVEARGFTCVFDTHTSQHIAAIARWLTAPRPKFGMLLCGQCGNGKTTLVRALASVIRLLYSDEVPSFQRYLRMVDAKQIVAIARRDDKDFSKLCSADLLAIDDLGIEPSEVLEYGNAISPAIDLLTHRYNNQLFTIVTTNLTPQQIREHYGDRIADRFAEMMERIVFSNQSYRNTL